MIDTKKPLTSEFSVNKLEITEYENSIEYHISYVEESISTVTNKIETNEIKTVVMHTKEDHTNTIVTFNVVEEVEEEEVEEE
jgi:hypothetical protein